ncbi:MAG: exodeoxyribonuclease VII large subunit [Pseudomonadota bacterium]
MPNKIKSVSEITNQIKFLLENEFSKVSVLGQLSNFMTHSSGHSYFTLKDEASSLSAVLFKGNWGKLKFKPENGLNVVCMGRISLYAPRGNYQIIVEEMKPAGLGELFLAYEKLKAKLNAEGLFDQEHKKKLPFLPERIGIITSITGAAIKDMLKVITTKFDKSEILIIDSKVQGNEAGKQLIKAIEFANKHQLAEVLIIGRGGGSIEDLWAFNDEALARAIFSSQIPVISAVGHEVDFTIADFVADVRAATPSVAGDIVVPDMNEIKKVLLNYSKVLNQNIINIIFKFKRELLHLSKRLKSPKQLIEEKKIRIDDLNLRLQNSIKQIFLTRKLLIEKLSSELNAYNPYLVLERGYCIARTMENLVIKSIDDVENKDLIELLLSKGSLACQVLKKIK